MRDQCYEVMCFIHGTNASTGNLFEKRRSYIAEEIVWGGLFANILSRDKFNRWVIDYSCFHKIITKEAVLHATASIEGAGASSAGGQQGGSSSGGARPQVSPSRSSKKQKPYSIKAAYPVPTAYLSAGPSIATSDEDGGFNKKRGGDDDNDDDDDDDDDADDDDDGEGDGKGNHTVQEMDLDPASPDKEDQEEVAEESDEDPADESIRGGLGIIRPKSTENMVHHSYSPTFSPSNNDPVNFGNVNEVRCLCIISLFC